MIELTLGHGSVSRLYKRLVDELNIATYVSVRHDALLLAGRLSIIVDARSEDDIEQINQVIDQEIARVIQDGIPESELSQTRTDYFSDLLRSLESVSSKNFMLSLGQLNRNDPDYYVSEYIEEINAVTPASIRASAQDLFSGGYHELTVLPFPEFAANAPNYDRSNGLPPRGPVKPASFPAVEKGTLSNGVEVYVASQPTVPVVEIAIQFDAGQATEFIPLSGEEVGKGGLGEMTVEMMQRGAGRLSALQIETQKKQLGAKINVRNLTDTTRATLSALKYNLSDSLDLFGEIVIEPTIPNAELEKIKTERAAFLRQSYGDAGLLGFFVLGHELYGAGHPYSNYQSASDAIGAMQSIETDDLGAWKNAWLRPDNATIFVTGDATLAEILPQLESIFGRWSPPNIPAGQKSLPMKANPDSPRVIIVDKKDMLQSVVIAGRLLNQDAARDEDALFVMNEAFGGGFISRINGNIREDKGWSYGVFSSVANAQGQRMFSLQAPVQADRTGDSITELLKEMNEFTGERPHTPRELKKSIDSVTGTQSAFFETARAVLGSMMNSHANGRPLDYAASRAGRFQDLSLEDVRQAAIDHVKTDDLTWVIVGDWTKIEPQIRALELGEIEVRQAE